MEENALEHLENCQEELEKLMDRPILVNAGRVSIYTDSAQDSIDCYKALKTLFGTDLNRYGPNVLRKIIKEDRKDWDRMRKKALERVKDTTKGS